MLNEIAWNFDMELYEALPEPDVDRCKRKKFTTLLALGWLLEEIHVTWAHLEKKRTRLRLYTKSLEEYAYNA
ncbi:hypothetical protein Tco_1532558 [Tanacetum coccineum]